MTKKRKRKIGLSPGSMVYTGHLDSGEKQILVTRYNANDYKEITLKDFNEDKISPVPGHINWVDVRGLEHTDIIEKIGESYSLHPILLENIVDVEQRPKFEEFENGIFIIIDSLKYITESTTIQNTQIALFFGTDFLLSFQEGKDDHFEHVRERISKAIGRIRKRGTDYLAYALIDSLVDSYYLAMDQIEEQIELLETNIEGSESKFIRERILALKKELIHVRKSVLPLREALSKFSRMESELIEASTSVFIRDVYDHVVYIMDLIESFKDMLSGIYDIYIAQISLKMNNVMKALTIISAIFIPLSFIASVYGMNFEFMPELHNPYGYYGILGVMFCISVAMIIMFKKRGWFD
ncbi:MAG TPA: magnesium/cobalt transporter CorA [Saprospiraceae bacterium]|nr:magnesium/cobalt transporter CorA [Saprospiraceae bacterium]